MVEANGARRPANSGHGALRRFVAEHPMLQQSTEGLGDHNPTPLTPSCCLLGVERMSRLITPAVATAFGLRQQATTGGTWAEWRNSRRSVGRGEVECYTEHHHINSHGTQEVPTCNPEHLCYGLLQQIKILRKSTLKISTEVALLQSPGCCCSRCCSRAEPIDVSRSDNMMFRLTHHYIDGLY